MIFGGDLTSSFEAESKTLGPELQIRKSSLRDLDSVRPHTREYLGYKSK